MLHRKISRLIKIHLYKYQQDMYNNKKVAWNVSKSHVIIFTVFLIAAAKMVQHRQQCTPRFIKYPKFYDIETITPLNYYQ